MMDLFTQYSQVPETANMWQWAFAHPYLYTIIKIGTPSLYAVILYIGFRVVTTFFDNKKRRY